MHRGISLSGVHRGGNNVYDGKIAGLYDLEETLGRGHFAVVKLARHVFTGEKVAVKVIDKSKLDEVSRSHLFQEVRCMKLVQHPNVVRLYEVIDTQTKLYLILELGDGGDLYDYIMRHEAGLTEQVAREYFRQIVRAISYCHRLHVVHRDLKPENVVFFEKLGIVKLTDFGFSNKFCPGQKLETSCGSLAYSAPEILLGDSYDAPAVDVWSLGVILYMLVCGQAPFQEANDSETLTMIMDCKYTIPQHVSSACKRLIGRMLVREPEKRATLTQIAGDSWLAEGQSDPNIEYLPLVSRHQVSDEDHNLIIQKMVNGSIATKEEISEALDRNEYNHITATYFLLAERKLRAHRQEQVQRKRPEQLKLAPQTKNAGTNCSNSLQIGNNNLVPNPSLLSVPRTPGDLPQRARKCSIVQEEEDEEDLSSSGREELSTGHCSLNRRGSRSEGKLNVALQERIAESERRRDVLIPSSQDITEKPKPTIWKQMSSNVSVDRPKTVLNRPKTTPSTDKWKNVNSRSVDSATPPPTIQITGITTTTTILNESSTISIPIHTSPNLSSQVMPKYKTMPSPTRPLNSVLTAQLNEIFEEGDGHSQETATKASPKHYVSRTQNRAATYEQRRSKFHKARTASCSSSDASDDDSESRKKRAHKINTTGKPLPGRRDSHDDSSDSQDQGTGGGASGPPGAGQSSETSRTTTNTTSTQEDGKSNSSSQNNQNTGRKSQASSVGFTKRQRNGRRRSGETRLRESQSLNRITEVQEDVHSNIVISTTVNVSHSTNISATATSPKNKRSFGARLLNSWSKKPQHNEHQSRKDLTEKNNENIMQLHVSPKSRCRSEEKENFKVKIIANEKSKKMRLLGRYFQVHKKLCIPLPGIFGRGRIYKAQSCSSLARDRISSPGSVVTRPVKNRPMSEVGNKLLGSDSDINQNNFEVENSVEVHAVCSGVSGGVCQLHLGDTTKCCSLC